MALISKKAAATPPSRSSIAAGWILSILLFVTAVFGLVGVYETHVLVSEDALRMQFGSTSGSLAIIAFVIALVAWKKSLRCPCACK